MSPDSKEGFQLQPVHDHLAVEEAAPPEGAQRHGADVEEGDAVPTAPPHRQPLGEGDQVKLGLQQTMSSSLKTIWLCQKEVQRPGAAVRPPADQRPQQVVHQQVEQLNESQLS